MDLQNKVAIVTGAGSGIGREIAIDFARHGCTLVLVGRRKDKLEETLGDVSTYAPNSTTESCDVGDKERVREVVNASLERYGHIDILVNNAGMMTVKMFAELTEDEFDRHMAVNYYGAVHLVRAVVPIMESQGKGVILNVASVGGKLCVPGTSAYSASKAALYAFSEALHCELRHKGIHIGVVLPGGTRTEIHDTVCNELGEYQRDQCTTPPSKLARSIRQAVERERFETVVPSSYKLYIMFHGAFPGLFRSFVVRKLRPYFG